MIFIVTDSTSDLPKEIVETYAIRVVPAVLILSGEAYEDGVHLSREEFYRRLPDLDQLPTTAAPSGGKFQQVYQACFDAGASHVISIHVASTLSGMYTSALVGAESFNGRVTVIDSGQLSLGLGFQVMAAAEAVAAGASIGEVLEAVQQTRNRLHVVAMLDTLEYLRRGGRVSLIKAGLGAMFRVRLFIELHDGKLNFLEQVRTRKKAIARIWDLVVSLGKIERFALLHAAAEEEAQQLVQMLSLDLPESAMVVNVNTVIGTHVGPGALGFAAIIKK